jgi:hypothetical protein
MKALNTQVNSPAMAVGRVKSRGNPVKAIRNCTCAPGTGFRAYASGGIVLFAMQEEGAQPFSTGTRQRFFSFKKA